MVIEGSYSFPAPVESVLAALGDADTLAAAIPGCERLIQLGPAGRDGATSYEARLRLHDTVYIAGLTVIPAPDERLLRVRIDGRGPEGRFQGTGELALGSATAGEAYTAANYTLELEAPGLSEAQTHALANGSGRLFACAICDQLTEDVRARARRDDSADDDDLADAEEVLRIGRVDRLLRAKTPLGEIVALPRERPEPFSPLWFQYAGGMLAGLAVGLSVIAVTAVTVRRLLGRSHKH
jgi:carbon monoxide dehydrogenase subunit G